MPPASRRRLVLILLCLLAPLPGCTAPAPRACKASNAAEVMQIADAGPPPPAAPESWWDQHPVFKGVLIAVGIVSFAFTVMVIGVMIDFNNG